MHVYFFLNLCFAAGQVFAANVSGVKVVVIGAGSAGLSATQDLIKAGFDVTLLEALNRYGGRLWSVPSETGSGWIEMGGQWVHGDNHPLYTFTQSKNLLKKAYEAPKNANGEDGSEEEEDDNSKPWLINADGSKVTNFLTHLRMYGAVNSVTSDESEYDQLRQQRDLSLGQHFLNSYQKLRKRIKAENRQAADEMYDVFIRTQKEDYGAASFFDVSVQSATNITLDGPDSTDLSVPYTDVLKMWAPDAVARVQYNSMVRQVRFNPSASKPMMVVLANGTQIMADHVVMTAPIGHLKAHLHEMFSPALSQRKQLAIQSVGFGTLGKVHLVYDNEWWTDVMPSYWTYLYNTGNDINVDRNKSYPGQPWTRTVDTFMVAPTTTKTIVVLMGGQQAVDMERMSDAEVSKSVTDLFRQTTGKNLPAPKKVLRARWSQNDLFRGTYSHISLDMVKKGLTTSDLASSEYPYQKTGNGRTVQLPGLLFAGEATHPKYWQMVHGALLSGQREAKTLKDLYRM
ncbi:spermine oxidase-like [Paramacrobiotus metropolitanus]|uniref:spermine oxidase-like n=1 Tax=Paramacrobiotus metropolitanus TaxID=2943436 RepID=UPI0024458467|nr:spermine oxidase-like [Paramacrobiotus metropolitanus]